MRNSSELAKIVTVAIALAAPAVANADGLADVLDLNAVATAGSGCSAESPGAFAFVEKTGEAAVAFTAYEVSAGETARIARANCALSIPFALGADQRLVLSDGAIAGEANLAAGTSLRLNGELFLAGASGLMLAREWEPQAEVFAGPVEAKSEGALRSACGANGIVRMNSAALAEAAQERKRASARVQRMSFKVALESCLEK